MHDLNSVRLGVHAAEVVCWGWKDVLNMSRDFLCGKYFFSDAVMYE